MDRREAFFSGSRTGIGIRHCRYLLCAGNKHVYLILYRILWEMMSKRLRLDRIRNKPEYKYPSVREEARHRLRTDEKSDHKSTFPVGIFPGTAIIPELETMPGKCRRRQSFFEGLFTAIVFEGPFIEKENCL